jgi:hypothetical protein
MGCLGFETKRQTLLGPLRILGRIRAIQQGGTRSCRRALRLRGRGERSPAPEAEYDELVALIWEPTFDIRSTLAKVIKLREI